MRQCKVCGLEKKLRDEVESKLLSGEPVSKITSHLKQLNISISTSSVSRHLAIHMDGRVKKPSAKPETVASRSVASEPTTYESVDKYREKATTANMLQEVIAERRTSQLLLEKVVQNQLTIVQTLQNEFMTKNAAYPRDPILGLKSVMDLIVKLPAYSEQTLWQESQRVDDRVKSVRVIAKFVKDVKAFHKSSGDYVVGQYLRSSDTLPTNLPAQLKDSENESYNELWGLVKTNLSAGAVQLLELSLVCGKGWSVSNFGRSNIAKKLARVVESKTTLSEQIASLTDPEYL